MTFRSGMVEAKRPPPSGISGDAKYPIAFGWLTPVADRSKSKPGITALLVVRNEAERIGHALQSLIGWVDEIVVVDGTSTDDTVVIAKEFGARVFVRPPAGFSEADRRFAVEQANHEWIVMLDADEILPRGLAQVLLGLASQGNVDVAFLPRENWLIGKPMKATGWGPDQDLQLRFFRAASVEISERIHEYIRPTMDARTVRLRKDVHGAIVHFNYKGFDDFLGRLNRYTTIEADQVVAGKRRRPKVGNAFVEFAMRWIRWGGFRDGWRGWHLSWMMFAYRLAVNAKIKELEMLKTNYDQAYETASENIPLYGGDASSFRGPP